MGRCRPTGRRVRAREGGLRFNKALNPRRDIERCPVSTPYAPVFGDMLSKFDDDPVNSIIDLASFSTCSHRIHPWTSNMLTWICISQFVSGRLAPRHYRLWRLMKTTRHAIGLNGVWQLGNCSVIFTKASLPAYCTYNAYP